MTGREEYTKEEGAQEGGKGGRKVPNLLSSPGLYLEMERECSCCHLQQVVGPPADKGGADRVQDVR